jgi:Nif-specific regulatory protein
MSDVTPARFLRCLLDLQTHPKPAYAVAEALALLAALTGARIAYLEIFDEHGVPQFSRAHGAIGHDLDVVRGAISRGIIGHALAHGETIATASALDDIRFKDLGSVQQHQIAAVLCAPIGFGDGVVYLQGNHDARAFDLHDRDSTALLARELAPMRPWLLGAPPKLEHLVQARKREIIARTLQRNDGNVTAAARELGIGRALIHRTIRMK